jgi:hypothetical protein
MNEAREQLDRLGFDVYYEALSIRVARLSVADYREQHRKAGDFVAAAECDRCIDVFDEQLLKLAEAEATLAEEARLIMEP